jgi:hypothetical protein
MQKGSYYMEILVDGVPLSELHDRGTTYVQALEGKEYTIRLRNRTGERIAVALSVDGLNSIDAKSTTAREASKWILGPYETMTVGGWQTSSSSARKFFFTTEERSYGAWLGKTKNLGIISAAVFREKRPRPVPIRRFDSPNAPQPSAPAEAESMGLDQGRRREAKQKSTVSDDLAATGIGREYGHAVRRVKFDAERSPASVLEVRYEYHDALVRLGVLPAPYICDDDPLSRRERAHGFEDFDFAPDPFRD